MSPSIRTRRPIHGCSERHEAARPRHDHVIGTETGGFGHDHLDRPDTGKPWRPRFDAKTLLFEERMLQAACYLVCAYLTGMRDAEVQAMRAGSRGSAQRGWDC